MEEWFSSGDSQTFPGAAKSISFLPGTPRCKPTDNTAEGLRNISFLRVFSDIYSTFKSIKLCGWKATLNACCPICQEIFFFLQRFFFFYSFKAGLCSVPSDFLLEDLSIFALTSYTLIWWSAAWWLVQTTRSKNHFQFYLIFILILL